MVRRRVSRFSFGIAIIVAFVASTGVGNAVSCSTVSSTVTCTGGPGASYNFSGHAGGTVVAASPFPSTIAVTGAGAGTTVSSMTLTLHGYTSAFVSGSQRASRGIGLLLVSPANHNLQVIRFVGQATSAQNNMTVTLQDGASAIPSSNGSDSPNGPWTASGTYAPSAWDATSVGNGMLKNPNYTAVGGPALQHSAPPNGTAPNTLGGVFVGDPANGNWSLYMVNDDEGASISFTSWDIVITFSGATTPSTTTLSPSPSTAYRTAPGNSVTLTATVTAGATGTVLFKDGSTNLTCTEGSNPPGRPISSNQAVCTTSFSTEGVHSLSAVYSGNGTFVTSTGSANVFIQSHATNSGNTYCNAGAITNDGHSDAVYTSTSPYPSVIFVGDGVNVDQPNSVSTLSVQLKNFSSTQTNAMHMLLVAPDGSHALEFWGDAGAGSTTGTGDYTLIDGSPQLPNAPISPGSYGPTTYFNTDVFSPLPPSPAPQPPGSFNLAAPAGSKTFQTSFVGAAAHGAWSLYLWNSNGTTSASGGWCLNISPATGHPTTVNVTSNPFPNAVKNSSVTFTATVSSSPTPNQGTVTFTENGAPLTGAPNGGVANVSGGVASIATSGLPEGDHTITASYHDSTSTFNDNFGTVTMRVDAATATPTLSGSTWSYCNPTGIVIPRGVNFVDDIGAATPNPSNIFVTNLPGTISAVSLTMKGFHLTSPGDLESLLVGPNGASAPTTAQTLDFFSRAGGNGGSTAFSHDTTFADGFSLVSCAAGGPAPGASNAPTSCPGSDSFFASPFYTLPGTLQRAATAGSFTFNTGTAGNPAVYKNTLANGTWSVYFNQLIHHSGDGATSWCMNFTENPVTVTAVKAHTSPIANMHFRQGQQSGANYTFVITNNGDFQGNGSTGDPDGNHPLQIVDTFDTSAFTLGTLPTGTPWDCSAAGNVVTCKNHSAIAPGASYPTLTIPVKVKNNAPASATNQGALSGGGITATSTNTDSVTIDPAAVLAVTKAHSGNFTQGTTANWTLQVKNNSATAAGITDGSTVTVVDTLPAGYTLNAFTGTNWNCTGNNVVTCTSSDVIAGNGGSFPLITLTVNVPADSPTSVNNSAKVYGGGDVIHVDAATAAVSNTDTVTVIQVPASVTINGSATQTAQINTTFVGSSAFAVTVKDAGGVIIQNYSSVVFTAPASGQSGTFDNASNTKSVTTDTSGIANPGGFTANGTVGAYQMTAVAGTASATFNLTNIAPDLTATKSDNVSHATNLPTGWTWKITVANSGTSSANFPATATILTDSLPNSNITYGTPLVSNIIGTIDQSGQISCQIASNNLICMALGATVTMHAGSSFDVTFTATPTAVGTFANPRSGGTCAVDPNGFAQESSEANNSCSDSVTVSAPDLTVAKTHSPSSFTVNDTNDTITVTVTNQGTAASSGTVTVTDTLPAGLTFNGTSTAGWSCSANGVNPVVCTTTNAIAATNGTKQLVLNVNVASSTSSPLTNNVSVACTCTESSTGNNSNTDSITVIQTGNITLDTSPTGLQVSVDGGSNFTAPHTYSLAVGTMHTIATTSPQTGGGFRYTWTSWSDAMPISHSITVPSSPTTYTANFGTEVLLTTQVSPASGGSILPATGYVTQGSMVSVSATPNAGYTFTGFTGGLTGSTNPQSITMNNPATVTANFQPGPTSLGGTLLSKTGTQNARVWSFSLTNPGPGAAVSMQATSFTLTQTAGAACTPVISGPSFPASLGDVAPSGSAPLNVTINFTGCVATAKFTMSMPLTANGGAATGNVVRMNEFR